MNTAPNPSLSGPGSVSFVVDSATRLFRRPGIPPFLRFSVFVLLVCAAGALAAEAEGFRRRVGEVEIDWSTGTLTAQAGAAADVRMPGPNAARPGAERRARAAAETKLRVALESLLPGTVVEAKTLTAQATVSRVEYQSNGGVVLWLALRLGDVLPVRPADVALRVASMAFTARPSVSVGGKSLTLGLATFRPAVDAPKDAVVARAERDGRLVLGAVDAKLADAVAGRAVVIYVEKPKP
jgi:hypothetical protein